MLCCVPNALRSQRHSPADLVSLLNVARTAGLLILLPAAFLLACEDSIDTILGAGSAFRDLSEINFDWLFKGQRHLFCIARSDVFSAIYSKTRDISPHCLSTNVCHTARHAIMAEFVEIEDHGTLNAFSPVDFNKPPASSLRVNCHTVFKDSYVSGRKKAWENLPADFGLPSWEDMKNARDETLSE